MVGQPQATSLGQVPHGRKRTLGGVVLDAAHTDSRPGLRAAPPAPLIERLLGATAGVLALLSPARLGPSTGASSATEKAGNSESDPAGGDAAQAYQPPEHDKAGGSAVINILNVPHGESTQPPSQPNVPLNESGPLEPYELGPTVTMPTQVGDSVAARQASFTWTWHRATIVRVRRHGNRTVHTVQWEDGSLTPDVPLSRLRGITPPGGPSVGDTTHSKLPAQPTGQGTQGNAQRITDAEQGNVVDRGFDEASFLSSLPDGELRVMGAPSIYAPPPADVAPDGSRSGACGPGSTAKPRTALQGKAAPHGCSPLGSTHGVARHVERRALGQDHSVSSPTGRGRSEVQSNETPGTAHT